MDDIKGCPFCGSKQIAILFDEGCCWLECWRCGVTSPAAESRAEAIAIWNRRSDCKRMATIVCEQAAGAVI
jgi:Lar family restriction alleviation protein